MGSVATKCWEWWGVLDFSLPNGCMKDVLDGFINGWINALMGISINGWTGDVVSAFNTDVSDDLVGDLVLVFAFNELITCSDFVK